MNRRQKIKKSTLSFSGLAINLERKAQKLKRNPWSRRTSPSSCRSPTQRTWRTTSTTARWTRRAHWTSSLYAARTNQLRNQLFNNHDQLFIDYDRQRGPERVRNTRGEWWHDADVDQQRFEQCQEADDDYRQF